MNISRSSSLGTFSTTSSDGVTEIQEQSSEGSNNIRDITGAAPQRASLSLRNTGTTLLPTESESVSTHDIMDVTTHSPSSPSSHSNSVEDEHSQYLEELGRKKVALEARIRLEEGVEFSPDIEGSSELANHHTCYITHLKKALAIYEKAILMTHESQRLSAQQVLAQEPETSAALFFVEVTRQLPVRLIVMETIAKFVIQTAEEMKSLASEITLKKLEQGANALSSDKKLLLEEGIEALKEAGKAISHYSDYADAIQPMPDEKIILHYKHFYLGNECANLFKSKRAFYAEKGAVAHLYYRAYEYHTKAVLGVVDISNNENECSPDTYKSLFFAKAGECFAQAADQLEQGNVEESNVFELAGSVCHEFELRMDLPKNNKNDEIRFYLTKSYDYFWRAASALIKGDRFYYQSARFIGVCLHNLAQAIEKGESEVAYLFQEAYLLQVQREERDGKNAFTPIEVKDSLDKVACCLFHAAKALYQGKSELSNFYKRAGECHRKVITTCPELADLYHQAYCSYVNFLAIEENIFEATTGHAEKDERVTDTIDSTQQPTSHAQEKKSFFLKAGENFWLAANEFEKGDDSLGELCKLAGIACLSVNRTVHLSNKLQSNCFRTAVTLFSAAIDAFKKGDHYNSRSSKFMGVCMQRVGEAIADEKPEIACLYNEAYVMQGKSQHGEVRNILNNLEIENMIDDAAYCFFYSAVALEHDQKRLSDLYQQAANYSKKAIVTTHEQAAQYYSWIARCYFDRASFLKAGIPLIKNSLGFWAECIKHIPEAVEAIEALEQGKSDPMIDECAKYFSICILNLHKAANVAQRNTEKADEQSHLYALLAETTYRCACAMRPSHFHLGLINHWQKASLHYNEQVIAMEATMSNNG